MKIELVIFLHSHIDYPNEPYRFDIWYVSGQEIPMDYLNDLIEDNEEETQQLFYDLEPEQTYRVVLFFDTYEDHYESFVISSEKVVMNESEEMCK